MLVFRGVSKIGFLIFIRCCGWWENIRRNARCEGGVRIVAHTYDFTTFSRLVEVRATLVLIAHTSMGLYGAQETWIPVVSRWHNWYRRPSMDGDGQEPNFNKSSRSYATSGGAEQYGLRAAYSVFVGFSRNHSYYQP